MGKPNAPLADGSLAVANFSGNSVTVYAANAIGNVAPTRTISGTSTGLSLPYGVATLADGSLAVANSDNNSVTVYAANATGDVAPTRTISGGSTGLNAPVGVATLADNSLAVTNFGNNSVTVYQVAATYAVTYNANGATSGTAPVSQTKTYDVALTLATNSGNLAKTGSTFAGWNTATDGSGTDYAAGSSYTANAALTLYAKWTADTYAVTYNANGATSGTVPASQTKTYDVALTLATNSGTLAKTGATFAGWNTAADGTGTDYAAGSSYTANAALTLYAKWTAAPVLTPATQTVSGTVGSPITATTAYTATGFTRTVSYTISPVLPSGLSLNANTGVISGTPTATQTATTHTVTGTGTNSSLAARVLVAPQTATATVIITVVAAPALSPATQTVTGQVGSPITTTTAYTATGFSGAVSYAISPDLPAGLSLSSTTGVISGTPTATQTTATFTVTANGATSGTATATVSITVLDTQATGTTPGGPVTAIITGGACLGYQAGSTQFTVPTSPPAGETFPYGVFGFTAVQCGAGGAVTITLTYPAALPAGTKYWKNISGTWVDWTSQVTIAGNTVVLTLTDGGTGDTNPTPGEISDPSGPAFGSGPTPIPTLSEWAMLLLGLLLSGLAWRQLAVPASHRRG